MGSGTVFRQTIPYLIVLLLVAGCADAPAEPTDTPVPATPTSTPRARPTGTTAPAAPAGRPVPAGLTRTSGSNPSVDLAASWPTMGWRTSTPEEQGMDSEKLADMFEHIQEEAYDIHSVTVIRHGSIVADGTVDPFLPDSTHNVYSVSSSIVSALIGIAIELGAIESVQQPVLSFFPERTVANRDAHKEAMSLEHLLMMASGLDCRDSYVTRWQDLNQLQQSDDWIQFMLDLPMVEEPGTRFNYCSGASFLLSAIIQKTTGMHTADFAEAHLFAPLGIVDVVWPADPQGITLGSSELRMRPHDMAKIGYLYLNEGRWDGEQIIAAGWVAASTRQRISTLSRDGFGYQWWTDDDGTYMAEGEKGQAIYVVPDQDLVVAFTANLDVFEFYDPETLLLYFIIPAAASSTTLPANPDGVARMRALIQELAAAPEVAAQPVPPPPAIAEQVLGESYILENNALGWHSFSLVQQDANEMLLRLTFEGPESVRVAEDVLEQEIYELLRRLTFDDAASLREAEYRLGLDGVQRVGAGEHGVLAAGSGYWQGENVFVAEVEEPGNLLGWRFETAFDGDDVTAMLTGNGRSTYAMRGKREAAP